MNKRIEMAWRGLEAALVSPTVGDAQRLEMRKLFFSGATVMFITMVEGVSEGDETTDADLDLLGELDTELREFGQQLDADWLRSIARGQG